MTKLPELISLSLGERLSFFENSFLQTQELIIRPFTIKNKINSKAALVYINNIVKTSELQEFVLRPLLETDMDYETTSIENFIYNTVQITNLKKEIDPQTLIDALLLGNSLILVEDLVPIFIADTPDWQKRALSSPISDRGKGSQIAFSEDLQMNLNVIRKVIKNNQLVIESNTVGKRTNTNYSIVYCDDLVDRVALDELHQKLKKINLDFVFDSNYLIENLHEKKLSPFPLLMTTERPDNACSAIVQGRIVIMVEGTSNVIMLPVTLPMFLQSADDYFVRWEFGINRILRFISLIITLYTPAIYVSLVCFHEEMLPASTYFTLISQSEGVPFPLVIEVIMLTLILQVIMDAIFRMNRDLILIISILGTFVIGDVAVNAGLIRPASIIVISITFISSFIQPRQQDFFSALRLLRFSFLLIANLFGFYGIIILSFFVVIHICSLRSFGVPYLTPIAPFNLKEQQDNFIRGDLNNITNKSHNIRHEDLIVEKKEKK
ncbi:spore germination protein [Bacillus sp. AFS017336]|uniref:spore germination protein n=1 Tax=Bacillus sp. AFS017336 TaxID=2033489 RepID=UPI0015CF1CAE|nr:spore germination protein [Bacillus sp. AFS017336]